ncbi:PD-(D/E)XK nuclease family protein [Treponema sp. OMZ 787]|uniref:PD-(D/E)XK nuclease family protein n=1 Tax=Treponema sp. OMZ 787 TaxID=2563669 RepID=UPI0020A513FC|nr:PD-(D/E)XK nuclease family protein [Treponema sp. OMZ 787]UTC62018.1 PD-(D/E)XK nuclease family protein [Treponema sp. OMZ 787]
MINLFDYATKELDQDAFFCWLFSWLKPEYREMEMHRHAKKFLLGVTPDNIQNEVRDIKKVEIKRQYKNIDFILLINDKFVYVFEDKTQTKEHDDQLTRYKTIVASDRSLKNYTPIFTFLKTDIVSEEERKEVTQKGYSVLDIEKILSLFDENSTNSIYIDYFESIQNRIKKIRLIGQAVFDTETKNQFKNRILNEKRYDNILLPSLFDYATKELSQDAFFCWLFEWVHDDYKGLPVYEYAIKLLSHITPDNLKDKIKKIEKVEIKKQYERIDFIVIINDELIYMFEDKVKTKEHDNQLERYKETISKHFPRCTPIYVYLKTNIVWPEEIKIVQAKDFLVLDIYKIREILQGTCNNNIYMDFLQILDRRIGEIEAFDKEDINNWTYDNWMGFVYTVSKHVRYEVFDTFHENAAWWFVMSWIKKFRGYDNIDIALEINTRKLVVKLYLWKEARYISEKCKALVKDDLDFITQQFQKYSPKITNRTGKHSITIFSIPNFIKTKNGNKLDMEKTLAFIKQVQDEFDVIVPERSNSNLPKEKLVLPQQIQKKNELPSKKNGVKSTKEKTNTDIPKSSNKNSIAKMLNRPIDPMHQPGDISFENIAVSNWEVKDWLNFIKKLETRVRYTVSGRRNNNFWFIMSVIKGFGGNPHTDIGLEINTKQLVVKLYVNDDIQDPDKQKDFRKQQRDSIERYLIGIMNEFQEYDIKYNKRTGKSVIIFEILDFPITRDGQKIDMEKTIELIETVQSKFETVVPKWSNKLIADRNKG